MWCAENHSRGTVTRTSFLTLLDYHPWSVQMSYTVLKRDIRNVVIITFVLLWFYENVYTDRNNNHVGLYYLKLICVCKINDIFLDKLFLQGMMWIKISVLIMHVWFTLSQEYALPLNYVITPPGGFLWKQELTIISSQPRASIGGGRGDASPHFSGWGDSIGIVPPPTF